ncbi:hypothetical protein BGZ67_005371 [Mortierella alpina]|nr:hypothetical protein BGZ67_005371 [Mortierella alpina]
MAASSHQLPHQEPQLHDSEYTSDSNDEFASASEGDDDLPWEPVVIRSPMVSRQSPQFVESGECTPRPSRANVESDHTQDQQDQQDQQEEHPARLQQQQQHQDIVRLPPQQQHHQWHQASDPDGNQTTSSSSSASRTTYSQSSLPHLNQHASSFSTTTTRVETSSTPTRSRSTPKLRERVRQSPVLHSRIVRAYLNPNASSAHQHASPEFVREAWLQEHQETHRDSSEEEEEEENTDLLEADDSWGFDDTLNIGETTQEDQQESAQAFDEPTVVSDKASSAQFSAVALDVRRPDTTSASMIHRNHELDLDDEDAWGGDDQLLDLVEADIQSTLAPHPVIQEEEEQFIEQDGWNQEQYDDEHMSVQEHASVDEYEQEHGHQTDAYVDETIPADRNPLTSSEDSLQQGHSIASALQQSSAHENYPSDNVRVEDTTSVELLNHLDAEAAWYEGEVFEQHSAHEELRNATVEGILENDAQPEPEVTSRGDTHDAPSQDSQSQEEISMGSDAQDAAASWGFDMDQVLDIEAYPIDEAPVPQASLQDNQLCSTDNVKHHDSQDQEVAQVDAPQFLAELRDASLAPESLQIDHSAAIIPEQDLNQNVQGSDDENDTEVREIMQAAQHNPFISSDDCLQTDQSSVALSSIISDSELAADNEDGRTSDDAAQPTQPTHSHDEKPFLNDAPVVSHLSIMQDPIPEPLELGSLSTTYEQHESSNVAQDLGGVASDSEGSDIYGDLSTAHSGINASSNRLNEILDDDDYLEHMERGVPMNRSISTPYSDDESPKFIVEDEIVELMERGEPRGLDATSMELNDDLDDNSDNTSLAVHHARSPSPASASGMELDTPLGIVAHSDRVESFDPATQTPEESSTATATVDATMDGLETAAPISTTLDILETTPCIDVSVSAEEPFMAPLVREEAHPVEAVAIVASDDKDPANPFSDAAAVEAGNDSWPVPVQPIGTSSLYQGDGIDQENADTFDEAANQDSWLQPSLVESHLNVDIEDDDAWAEQDSNIVVDPVPPVSLPSHTETLPLIESDVINPGTLVASDPGEQPTLETSELTEPTLSLEMGVEDDSEGDGWGDDVDRHMDDISSAVQAGSDQILDTTHTLMQSDMPAHHDVQKNDYFDDFQKHYPPLLPADAPEDQVSESAWDGNHGVDAVAEVVEEDDAWSGNDEINVLEAQLYDPQTDRLEAPSLLEGTQELPAAQEPPFAVETQFSNVIRDVQPDSSLGDNVLAERISEATDLGDGIDEALVEEDAWGDQDQHILAEFTPADADLFKSEVESEPPVEVYESDQRPHLSTTHASIEHNNIVDNWSEEDAWNDENLDLMDVSSFAPKQEAEPPEAIDNHEEEHIDSRVAEPATTMTFGASDIFAGPGSQHTVDTAFDNDAWIDQDLNVDVAIDTQAGPLVTQGLPSVETAEPPSDVPETTEDSIQVEIGNAIHSDLREDLWSDHDLDLEVQDSELSGPGLFATGHDNNDEYQETGDHVPTSSVLEHYEPLADAGEEVFLESTQSVIKGASEPTSALSSEQLVEDALLDSALDGDAWGEQDVSIESELAEEPAHVDKVQDEGLDVKNEVRPSSILRVGSIIHQTTSEQPDDVVEDAWGWDEDEVGVHLEIEKETPPPSTEETMALADDLDASSPIEQYLDEQQYGHHGHADAEAEPASDSTTSTLQATAHSLLPAATDTADRLSPLAIHKEGILSGTDSGEGDEDSTNASHSPWQDVSPASISKRSEAGMSVGSEFESEYSIQSLDDDEHTSSSQAETKTPVETSMSCTILHTDGWQSDSQGPSGDLHGEDKSVQPAPSQVSEHKASQPALEIQDLPDISGADSWDFDQDDNDDLQSDLMAFKQEHSALTPRTGSTRDLKTPDMDEHPLLAQQSSTASPLPISPNQPQTPSTPSAAAAIPDDVEDDSHLPLAIRQQRARLAARGKPLPPISKYNSVKDTGAAADQTLSPRLSAATSPVTAFASPVKSPLSPMLKATSPGTSAASSSPTASAYLSPALQKQRERLEQKRAAAAAAAATPLSAARRLTVTYSPKALGSQLHVKPTSPLLLNKTLPSAFKSTLGSPTLAKKTVQLVGPPELLSTSTPLASPSSLGEESTQLSSRRRGSSAAPTPSSPLAEGFVRRSKDGSRPSIKPAAGLPSDTAVRTSQSDSHRHGSWLSNSSAQSGWDETFGDDDHQDKTERDSDSRVSTNVATKGRKESALFSSASPNSFYQQTVPGIDDSDSYGPKTSKIPAPIATSSPPTLASSSYLSSKKADDYDAHGPMARKSGKSKSSMEDSTGSAMTDHNNETLIGGSTMSSKTNVSLLSPTFATSMSHRHDHHHGHHSSTTSGGGFFAGGSNSLVGDISTLLNEKSTPPQGHPSGSGSYENDNHHNKKPPPSSNLQKSSSWSFGSWVSSAVAVASEKIDKAYETLDPEYSRMKTRGGSSALSTIDDGSPDPESTSPFKKPGYVVGGSSLALGLASISTGPPAGSSKAPQQQQLHHASPPASMTPAGLGFGSRGGHGGGDAGSGALDSRAEQQHESHAPEQRMPDWEREQATTPRLTRKNVSGR